MKKLALLIPLLSLSISGCNTARTSSAPTTSTIAQVQILNETSVLDVDQTLQIELAATTLAVTFESSDTSVATVSETGLVQPLAVGPVTITASSGELSDTIDLDIVETRGFFTSTITIALNSEVNLNFINVALADVTFEASVADVVSLRQAEGQVYATGLALGTTVVSAIGEGVSSASVEIHVVNANFKVKFDTTIYPIDIVGAPVGPLASLKLVRDYLGDLDAVFFSDGSISNLINNYLAGEDLDYESLLQAQVSIAANLAAVDVTYTNFRINSWESIASEFSTDAATLAAEFGPYNPSVVTWSMSGSFTLRGELAAAVGRIDKISLNGRGFAVVQGTSEGPYIPSWSGNNFEFTYLSAINELVFNRPLNRAGARALADTYIPEMFDLFNAPSSSKIEAMTTKYYHGNQYVQNIASANLADSTVAFGRDVATLTTPTLVSSRALSWSDFIYEYHEGFTQDMAAYYVLETLAEYRYSFDFIGLQALVEYKYSYTIDYLDPGIGPVTQTSTFLVLVIDAGFGLEVRPVVMPIFSVYGLNTPQIIQFV